MLIAYFWIAQYIIHFLEKINWHTGMNNFDKRYLNFLKVTPGKL